MDFKIILLVILCTGGCNSGVVPQHFMSNLTEPANAKIERVPTDFNKNESSSTPGIKADISTIAVGNEDLHNSSEVVIFGFHNISEELNLPKLNVSKESHPIVNNHPEESHPIVNNHSEESDHIVNNHSKDFGHSQKGVSKGSGRPRKKLPKGSNRFKNISNQTKNVGKVTKVHVTKDSLNELHHLENFTRELSHSDNDFLKKSDHAENLTEDHFKDLSNASHHAQDFVKESNHFDKDVTKMTNHAENITNITFNHKIINESGQVDGIMDHSNHFNNLLNESHHHKDVLNHSDSDVSKGLIENDNVTKPSGHPVEQNESSHFENVPEIRNETLNGFETTRDFQKHFDNTSGTLDETAKSTLNSSKIMDDHIAFLNHAENISQEVNLRHDLSDLNTFHEDSSQKMDEAHSENPASTMNPLIQHESFNSSEITLKDGERLSIGTDILISSTKEENSSDITINQTLLDVLLRKEDNLTPMNPQLNETNVMFTMSPNEDNTNSSTKLSHEFLQELKINTNDSKLLTENISSTTMAVEENATQGLFSGINFDFLLNSELAKNAASAMEVFNFTDSALTDHIMDDKNDVHDFLELIHPSEERDSKEEFQGSMKERDNLNGTEVDSGLNSSTSEDSAIFKVTTITSLLNSTVDFEETTIVSQPMLNSTVDFEETTTISQPMLNSTVDFEETTIVSQPMLNSTVDFEETTTVVPHLVFNSTVVEAICPPPGFCIFWFLAQDTCAVNSHCLGSRICCRIGCAKTCIEI